MTDYQRYPLGINVDTIARDRADTAIQRVGRRFPCSVVSVSGSIVTVKFEMETGNVTLPQAQMPVFGPEYIRYPLQVGDKGFAIAADAYLGQMSGLGDGVATFAEVPNLSALTFMPIGNKNWSSEDGNTLVLYGPGGVTLRNSSSSVTVQLTNSGISINNGGGTVNITGGGDVVINGTHFSSHKHSGVTIGTAQSGPPVPGS